MRQFIAGKKPDKDGCLSIDAKDEKYLTRVLRLKEGSSIDVRHKDGSIQSMSLLKKQNVWVLVPNVDSSVSVETGVKAADIPSFNKNFILLQFMPKLQKMDQIVRQASECGISEIYPVKGDFSSMKDCPERIDRWDRIVKEARQQSGSPVDTMVHEPADFMSVLKHLEDKKDVQTVYIVLTEAAPGSSSVFSILGSFTETERVVLAVGCEGGFSKKEMEMLDEAGFKHLHFNTNVLRAETAALYGIAVIQNAVMEKKSWREQE